MSSTCNPLPPQMRAGDADNAVFERAYVQGLLRDRESLWHALFAQSRDAVVVLDDAGKVFETNQRFADLLGYTMEELYQLHVWDWAHGLTRADLLGMMRAIDDEGHHFETQQVRKDGSLVDIELSNSCTFFRGQKLIFCICRDITERKAAERRIRYLATTDTLTGASNRGEFSRRFAEEIERAHRHRTPLGLVMFDLDHFKHINDSHGHDVGDAVLRGVMEVVRWNVRVGDVIGRWGGEEFMLLLPGLDLRDARGVAERLRAGIAAHRFEPVERVTASFGVVVLEHAEGFDALVKRVDVALYRAKSAGRNRVEAVSGD